MKSKIITYYIHIHITEIEQHLRCICFCLKKLYYIHEKYKNNVIDVYENIKTNSVIFIFSDL